MEPLLFFDLQNLTPGRPFAGFAAGEFVDMLGREIELRAKDLQRFIENTLKLIDEHKQRNMPGLPIDARKHDKGDAAGWITGAELGEVQDSEGATVPVIKLLAEWTTLGVRLLSEKIQTNFSPTVDLKDMVIRGGSLTNWPATVDKNGVPLFAAVELAQGISYLVKAEPVEVKIMWEDLTSEQRDALLAQAREQIKEERPLPSFDLSQLDDEARAELQQFVSATLDSERAEMQKQLRQQVDLSVAKYKAERHVADFAQSVTGRGLPIQHEQLETFLLSLNDEQRTVAEGLFNTVVENGLNEFSELGHGRELKNNRELPAVYSRLLRQWVQDGNDLSEFFELNPEVGEMSQYNLAQYKEKKDNG